jgi:hypothetical protein
MDRAVMAARGHAEQAVAALGALPPGPIRTALADIALFAAERAA